MFHKISVKTTYKKSENHEPSWRTKTWRGHMTARGRHDAVHVR